jgi:WWE domain
VAGTAAGSQVWVVYENGRAYPDYLVRYYRGERDPLRTPYAFKHEAPPTPARTESLSSYSESEGGSVASPVVDAETIPARQMIWEFSGDSGWREYCASDQNRIESAYQGFLSNPSMNAVRIQTDLWTYEVDLAVMVQTNLGHPGHNRRLIRRRDEALMGDLEEGSVAGTVPAVQEMVWEFRDNDGDGWREYGPLHQAIIEDAYLVFLADPNMDTVLIHNGTWLYEVDLAGMVQTNLGRPDHNRRLIRRRDGTLTSL